MRFSTAASNAFRFLYLHGLLLSVLSVKDAIRASRRLRRRAKLEDQDYELWFDLGGESG